MQLAVTAGDPSGIGPEICLKAVRKLGNLRNDLVLVGNTESLHNCAKLLGFSSSEFEKLNITDVGGKAGEIGKVRRESGEIALNSIERATAMALNGEVVSISTAPISKEAIMIAGSKMIDHTEILANLTGIPDVVTVFEVRGLRIIFMTKHCSLKQAVEHVKKDNIVRIIRLAEESLRLIGVSNGKVAVAALNPHAGENGIFGREEIEEIIPAIEEMQKRSYNVHGPYPADSVFHGASEGAFDMVISLYHDQGHIAAKMYDFLGTVSMNLGMPFLRTSPDHGTAFDIAGKGIANEESMLRAIQTAFKYGQKYRENYARIKSVI